jgi:hydroxycarboxylate dehydrogenase B
MVMTAEVQRQGWTRASAEGLRALSFRIFRSLGSSEDESGRVADHLVEANLRGHDSHGVGMLPVYVANALSGEMVLNRGPEIVRDMGSLLVCDGGRAVGQTIAAESLRLACTRAATHGSCIMAVRNSHHMGRIGAWAEQCAAEGMVSIHFVNVVSTPSVAPFGGRAPRVGTNPFAVGVPRDGAPPAIVDFATSRIAVGKVRVALNTGAALPEGMLLDGAGNPTTDPGAHFREPKGAILPFGEHKGWALAFACEVLAAALSGGQTQKGPKSRDAVINCLMSIVIDPRAIGTQESYFAELEAFIRWVQSPGQAGGEVLLPGDVERKTREERLAGGVPIDMMTREQLIASATRAGLPEQEAGRLVDG